MRMLGWVLCLIGTILGGLVFLVTITTANGAPQQAAGSAIAMGFCILPYCFARAVEELGRK